MPAISPVSSARGAETSAKPLAMKVLVLAAMAEGATGAPPSGCKDVVRNSPDMPELEEHMAAVGVDGVGDAPPGLDLRLGEAARRPDIALALLADLRRLGDDEAGAGALAIIERRERARHGVGLDGAVARQRRHGDAIRQA